MLKLKIVCAWCNKEMGEKEGPEVITHGICDDCLLKYLPNIYKKVKGALEVPTVEDIQKQREQGIEPRDARRRRSSRHCLTSNHILIVIYQKGRGQGIKRKVPPGQRQALSSKS